MIKATNIVRTFTTGNVSQKVLQGIDLDVKPGEFLAVMGRSGAGKSTLLYQLSLLDRPNAGKVVLDGVDTSRLDEQERTDFRLRNLGYVFQDYAIIPELTAVENVVVPILMQGMDAKSAYQKAIEALKWVHMEEYFYKLPSQLSGGEQQRVSVARSIAHEPKILFADEPTANLDSENALIVLKLLQDLNKKGQTIVMVTHELEYGRMADRIIHLDDGKIVSDKKVRP
ncbi:MAG: ABC transporter ATP-binding protein [Candidatus Peregrinibacteria bacterium]